MSTSYQRLIQINILPAEYRKALLSNFQIILILVIVIGLGTGYLLQQAASNTSANADRLLADQSAISRSIAELEPLVEEADKLRSEITAMEEKLKLFQSGYTAIADLRIAWPLVLDPMVVHLPDGIVLTNVDKVGRAFSLAGSSTRGVDAINEYHLKLTQSPEISNVTILDMKMLAGAEESPLVVFTMFLEVATHDIPQAKPEEAVQG